MAKGQKRWTPHEIDVLEAFPEDTPIPIRALLLNRSVPSVQQKMTRMEMKVVRDPKQSIKVQVHQKELEALQAISERTGLSISALMRMCIRNVLQTFAMEGGSNEA